MESRSITSSRWILCLAAAGFLSYVLSLAWISEDAYITFRVIDNFWNGYGLRWNVHERVQVFSHPLWMLLQLAFAGVWSNLFFVSIALSFTCVMAAVFLTLHTDKDRPAANALWIFFLPLLLSHAFIDYTTSGLENALCFLLMAGFGHVALTQSHRHDFWLRITLITSLALLTRLDMMVFYTPPLLYLLYMHRARLPWKQMALGLLPLMLWCLFSLFYYGFIFPNPKYAKIDTGLPLSDYLIQGLRYVRHLLVYDTASAVILLLPLLTFFRPTWFREPAFARSIATGVYCYCLYILCIGGDYMAGRFWALPVFAAVWLCYTLGTLKIRTDFASCFAGAWAIAAIAAFLPLHIGNYCDGCQPADNTIIDARPMFQKNQMVYVLYPLQIRSEGQYNRFFKEGHRLAGQSPSVHTASYIGMIGYYAGPKVTLIDELGLADPLLARLPANQRTGTYAGHFYRNIPAGYAKALETRSLSAMPAPLARYYEKLQLITSGDLLESERLQTILLFNLGAYDHWKREYLEHR